MQQINPIHELTAEHRVIEKAAALMEKMADQLTAGSGVDGSVLQDLVQFLRVYADELHHGKEEAILFPALEAKGVPQTGCPLGGLVAEHRKGRMLVDERIGAERIRKLAGFADRLDCHAGS